jgi:uncharacterized damage-inducible protein DinB
MASYKAVRPPADEFPPHFADYIEEAPAGDVLQSLRKEAKVTLALLKSVDEERAAYRYAPGKWSIREVVAHLADSERVFSYRLLSFARGDRAPLPSFDENEWVPEQEAERQRFRRVTDDFKSVRAATVTLLRTLPRKAWTRRGVASNNSMSVRALAWAIVGHEAHHRRILTERYLWG